MKREASSTRIQKKSKLTKLTEKCLRLLRRDMILPSSNITLHLSGMINLPIGSISKKQIQLAIPLKAFLIIMGLDKE